MRPWIAVALAAIIAAAACDSSVDTIAAAGHGGASSASSSSSSTTSTGGTGGTGGSTPKRKLIDVPFLEGSPTENRVDDPGLEMDTGTAWFFYDPTTGGAPHVNHESLPVAPKGQAALYIPGAPTNPNGVVLGVVFKLPASGYDASFWVGDGGSSVVSATLTFDPSGNDNPKQYALTPDPATAVVIDGIHWVEHKGTMPAEVVAGWAYLVMVTDGTKSVHIHAPVIIADDAMKPHPPPAPPTTPRADLIEAVRRATTPRHPPRPLPRLP